MPEINQVMESRHVIRELSPPLCPGLCGLHKNAHSSLDGSVSGSGVDSICPDHGAIGFRVTMEAQRNKNTTSIPPVYRHDLQRCNE